MYISDEVIKILEYLCDKIGITIDWTSNNVLPYVEQLCTKYITWEISTSYAWIGIMCALVIVGLIFSKIANMDGFEKVIFWTIVITAFIVVGAQIFDIIECKTFPEKTVYDYIQLQLNNSSR